MPFGLTTMSFTFQYLINKVFGIYTRNMFLYFFMIFLFAIQIVSQMMHLEAVLKILQDQ